MPKDTDTSRIDPESAKWRVPDKNSITFDQLYDRCMQDLQEIRTDLLEEFRGSRRNWTPDGKVRALAAVLEEDLKQPTDDERAPAKFRTLTPEEYLKQLEIYENNILNVEVTFRVNLARIIERALSEEPGMRRWDIQYNVSRRPLRSCLTAEQLTKYNSFLSERQSASMLITERINLLESRGVQVVLTNYSKHDYRQAVAATIQGGLDSSEDSTAATRKRELEDAAKENTSSAHRMSR